MSPEQLLQLGPDGRLLLVYFLKVVNRAEVALPTTVFVLLMRGIISTAERRLLRYH